MLTDLSISNLAVVSAAAIEAGPGMTVISGETGAGKSLLVDALLLLSGRRADSGVVRHGADRAEVSATFSLANAPPALAWLSDNEMQDGAGEPGADSTQAIVRRIVRADGGSKAWINGRSASVSQLTDFVSRCVSIHGQHDQQALLQRPSQLRLLDAYARHPDLLAAVGEAARSWQTALNRRDELLAKGDVNDRSLFLQHQLAELDREELAPERLQQLVSDHRRIGNADSLLERLNRHLADIQGSPDSEFGGAQAAVARILSELTRHAAGDADLEQIANVLAEADTALAEAASGIERLIDSLELDPEAFAELDRRLTRVHELARKHRVELHDLAGKQAQLAQELQELQGLETELAGLDAQIAAHRQSYLDAAKTLSASRRKAALALGKHVSASMQELGMSGGAFSLDLEPSKSLTPDPQGQERVEMLVAANPGQPPRPLRKVASGGELSRISLALEVVTIGLDPVPTMVFDEIDSGIGGAVADAVGQRLRRLGESRQVLCVTHLPQVASAGHTHYRVQKFADAGLTQSEISPLDHQGRVDEIARMLGGSKVTDAARAAAQALLDGHAQAAH